MNRMYFLILTVTLVCGYPASARTNTPIVNCAETCAELRQSIAQIGDSKKYAIGVFDKIRLLFHNTRIQKLKTIYNAEVLSHAKCLLDDEGAVLTVLDILYYELEKKMAERIKFLMMIGGVSIAHTLAWERYRDDVPGLIEDLCSLEETTLQNDE